MPIVIAIAVTLTLYPMLIHTTLIILTQTLHSIVIVIQVLVTKITAIAMGIATPPMPPLQSVNVEFLPSHS